MKMVRPEVTLITLKVDEGNTMYCDEIEWYWMGYQCGGWEFFSTLLPEY